MGKLLDSHRRLVRSTRVNPAVSFGTTVAAGFALFGWIGWWMDRKFGREYAFTLCGVAMAFLYTGYELWKIIRLSGSPPEEPASPPDRAKPPPPPSP